MRYLGHLEDACFGWFFFCFFALAATSLRPKSTAKVTKDEDDDLWGSIAAPPPKSASKPLNVKTAGAVDDDDPWAAIADRKSVV